jgi:hypothetical protein
MKSLSEYKQGVTMADANQLIYQNSNIYRIHADNLRWTLLGSYAAILAATFSFSKAELSDINSIDPTVSFILFFVSFAYLWVLAVQNWFYNLFAKFVDECEYRLWKGRKLRPLQEFAKEMGASISPFHPAFFFAEVIVGVVAYYFLFLSIKNSYIPTVSEFLNGLPSSILATLAILLFLIYFASLNFVFANWDKIVYKKIIVPFSNLYRPTST